MVRSLVNRKPRPGVAGPEPDTGRDVTVPDLLAVRLDVANARLAHLGLQAAPGAVGTSNAYLRGQVMGQSHPAGQVVRRGTTITLDVSLGTVSDHLQTVVDGPTGPGNAIELPIGELLLDKPLVISRWRTRIIRQDKWGRKAVLKGVEPSFIFDDSRIVVPGKQASIVFMDDPGHELRADGAHEIVPEAPQSFEGIDGFVPMNEG